MLNILFSYKVCVSKLCCYSHSVDVTSISCGPQHVVAVGHDGEVFAWGNGKDGRLGLGDEEK